VITGLDVLGVLLGLVIAWILITGVLLLIGDLLDIGPGD
jgi:hypothetical protein